MALLNTLSKFLESIVARRLSYMVETYVYCPQHTWVAAGVSLQTTQSRSC
jgi:hypothetical protein